MKRHLTVLVFSGLLAAHIAPAIAAGPMPPAESKESLSEADSLARAGDRAGAIAIIERFLEKNPGHTGAEVLLARTLGWAGEYEKAAGVYRRVIQREPEHAEAHAGLARVLSWKGDYDGSVSSYRRSLYSNPGSTETRMGLARTLWWKGDVDGALEELSRVIEREPENPEALELERRLRVQRGPYLKAAFSSSSDSDQTRLNVYHMSFSDTFGADGHRFDFGYRLFDASSPGRSAKAHTFDARDSIRVWGRATVTPRLQVVTLDPDAGGTTYLAGGLSLSAPVARGTRLSASVARYPLLDTPRLIENGIRVDEASLGIMRDLRRATVSAHAAAADYSDGNSRYDLGANVAVRLRDDPRIIAGVVTEYRDFSERTSSGYFNPPNILSSSLYLEASGKIAPRLGYSAKATLGTQSYEGASDYTSSFRAGFEWSASRDLWFDAGYKYSRSALESASGFRYEEFKAAVNYLF